MEQEIKQFWDLLGHEGLGWTLIRVKLDGCPIQNFYVDNYKDFEYCINANKNQGGDIWAGINPRKEKTGFAKDVSHITNLALDIDKLQPQAVVPHEGVLIQSGRGMHVYFPVNPVAVNGNLTELTDQIKAWTYEKRKEYEKAGFVDHTFDISRVMRCPGTINTKNGNPCKFVEYNPVRKNLKDIIGNVSVPSVSRPTLGTSKQLEQMKSSVQVKAILSRDFPSTSERVFNLVSYLAGQGLNHAEIESIVNDLGLSRGEKDGPDINRIIEKTVESNRLKSIQTYWGTYEKNLSRREKGFDTGFPTLNELTGGLRRKEMSLFGARTGVGKTTLVMNLALELLKQNLKVLVFPTEMYFESLIDKIVSMEARIDQWKLRDGKMDADDKAKVKGFGREFSNYKLFVSEIQMPTAELFAQEVQTVKPDIIILDYIQMAVDDNSELRSSGLEKFAHQIKACSSDHNAHLMVTTQFNEMDQTRDSRAIEHPCTLVGKLYLDAEQENSQYMTFRVTKNRFGPRGNVRLLHDTRFGTIIEEERQG